MKSRILVFLAGLAAVILSSCTQPQPTVSQPLTKAEPKLSIKATSENLPLNTWFPIQVTVENAPASQEFSVSVLGVGDALTEVPMATLKTDARGTGQFITNVKVTRATHVSLIASVAIGNESLSDSLEIVYDSPSTGFAAQSIGATSDVGQTMSIEDYYEEIPHVSDDNYVTTYEKTDGVLRDVDGQIIAGKPSTMFVDGIQYLDVAGNLTEPVSGLEYVLKGTGSGRPTPEDLETAQPTFTAQAAYCGSSSTTIRFLQVRDFDYSTNPPTRLHGAMPEGTYFRAVDTATFTDRILFEGRVGANGYTTFTYPNCDPSGGGQPDVYFIFETRNATNGLTASHGTVTRRHWWRTGTYWDYAPSEFNGKSIRAIGDNAEAINTQRLWYKVHQVYNWNRSALGDSSMFKLDVLYPVFTYFGVAKVSRAAIGQMQMVYQDANFDDTIFHEFGHEVYYRRMLGESAYHIAHSCSASAVCTSFPACGGCINHSVFKDIGPEAAMVEGWADFFEAVTFQQVPGKAVYLSKDAQTFATYAYIENFDAHPWTQDNKPVRVPVGVGSEWRVAAYLWDFWDNNSTGPTNDNDAVVTSGTAKERYGKVASHFNNMPLSSELRNIWQTNIKPNVGGTTQQLQHQSILNLNTLGAIY